MFYGINLKSHSLYEPGTVAHAISALGSRKDQLFRGSFGYIMSFRLSWAIPIPISKQANTFILGTNHRGNQVLSLSSYSFD